MRPARCLAWAGALAILAGAAHAAPPSHGRPPLAQARASSGGQIDLSFNRDALADLGLRVDGLRHGSLLLGLQAAADPLQVVLGDGAPTGFGDGALELPGLRMERADGQRTPLLRLVAGAAALDLSLRDVRDREWLRIEYAMRSPDLARDGLRFHTADLRVGPALAAFAQQPDAAGRILANAGLRMPLTVLDALARAKTCAAPVWNGVGGATTDVELTNIDAVDVLRCRLAGGGTCDGAGGGPDEVVIVPSATLRNSAAPDAADVPWYGKFTGVYAPYGNDQHPYLVWNLYRIDADGRIEQVARSGLKHAFATANAGCSDTTCLPNGNILGRGCSDLYNAGSNDCDTFLGPRADVIPSRGQWGRCGSIHDPDCDGVQAPPVGGGFCAAPNTSPAGDGYSFRLIAREADIDPAQNPGARWLVDAWYVVRDDVDIFNTMGSREVFPAPQATAPRWTMGTPGPFAVGPVIDRWLELAGSAGDALRRSDLRTAEGQVAVASRVHRLPDGRWQYDYAIANFDFARAQTDPGTAEPNLRILSNVGLDAVELELRQGATADSSEFRDGDGDSGNDWTPSVAPGAQRWTAPAGNRLDWGQLVFARLVSAAAPGEGALRLRVAAAGSPDWLALGTVVPDAGNVFRDGFE